MGDAGRTGVDIALDPNLMVESGLMTSVFAHTTGFFFEVAIVILLFAIESL